MEDMPSHDIDYMHTTCKKYHMSSFGYSVGYMWIHTLVVDYVASLVVLHCNYKVFITIR